MTVKLRPSLQKQGADPTGSTDSTAAVQRWLALGGAGVTLRGEPGHYKVSSPLNVPACTTIDGEWADVGDGEGVFNSLGLCLDWVGGNNQSMLNFGGLAGGIMMSKWRGVNLQISGGATGCTAMRVESNNSPSTHDVTVEDFTVGPGFQTGVELGQGVTLNLTTTNGSTTVAINSHSGYWSPAVVGWTIFGGIPGVAGSATISYVDATHGTLSVTPGAGAGTANLTATKDEEVGMVHLRRGRINSNSTAVGLHYGSDNSDAGVEFVTFNGGLHRVQIDACGQQHFVHCQHIGTPGGDGYFIPGRHDSIRITEHEDESLGSAGWLNIPATAGLDGSNVISLLGACVFDSSPTVAGLATILSMGNTLNANQVVTGSLCTVVSIADNGQAGTYAWSATGSGANSMIVPGYTGGGAMIAQFAKQVATPTTLAQVISLLQAYKLSA